MVVARVDYCNNRILQMLAPSSGAKLERKVEYSRHTVVDRGGRKVFTDDVVADGIAVIHELQAVAASHRGEAFSAVATSAFRSVDSGHAQIILERIRRETGLEVVVVPQDREARIGFLAAATKIGLPRERLVVWDVGGGSMQISYWDQENGAVKGYHGNFAIDAMQRLIIQVLRGRDYQATPSPNPIGSVDLSRAIQRAENAAANAPLEFLERVRTLGRGVIGIGGVHFSSNCEFTKRFSANGCMFSRDELRNQAYRYADLNDNELVDGGFSASIEFAPFRVSGAALTVGYMNVLGIESVRAVKLDMAEGILVDPSFWAE